MLRLRFSVRHSLGSLNYTSHNNSNKVCLNVWGKKKKRGGNTSSIAENYIWNQWDLCSSDFQQILVVILVSSPSPLDGNHHPLSMGLALKGIQWSSEQLICLSSKQSLTIGSFLLFFLPFFSLSHAHKNDEHICAFVGHIFNPYQYPFKKRHKNLFWKD